MLKHSLMLLIILLFPLASYANDQMPLINIGDDAVVPSATGNVMWAVGSAGGFDPTALDSLTWQQLTLPFDSKQGRSPIWYRFKIRNDAEETRQLVLSSLDGHVADFVVVEVRRSDGNPEVYFSGKKIPSDLRPSATRFISFPLMVQSREVVSLTIGISSVFSRNFLYQVTPLERYEWESQAINFFFGIHFGLMAFCLVMNAAVWFALRHPSHLAYTISCGLSLAAALIGTGFAGQLIPSTKIFPWSELQLVLIPLNVASMTWFNREFLELKKISQGIWRAANVVILVGLGLAAYISNSSNLEAIAILPKFIGLAGLFGLLTSIVTIVRNGSPFGWCYLLGSLIYFLGGFIWDLALTGIIRPTSLSLNAYFIAQMIENAVFTLAIAVHVRILFGQAVAARESKRHSEQMSMYNRVLAHDLTNYMTLIKLSAEKLTKGLCNPDEVIALGAKISAAVNRQRDVVTSVQKLLAVKSGKWDSDLIAVDLLKETMELKSFFANELQKKSLTLTVSKDVDGDVFAVADPRTLFQCVLANLVHNAIKFCRPGGAILVSIKKTPEYIFLTIADDGIGIPRKILPDIFSPEQPTTRDGTNGEKGVGFGLPICKAFIEAYGGSISVESTSEDESPESHGTTFVLTFKSVDGRNSSIREA